jgi:molybdopterin-binding protein
MKWSPRWLTPSGIYHSNIFKGASGCLEILQGSETAAAIRANRVSIISLKLN